jgi:ATP-binding cassette, subfamily B, bacterial
MKINKEPSKILPKTLFPFIWHFLKEHKVVVFIYVFLSVCAGFWGPFNSILIRKLINLLSNSSVNSAETLFFPAILVVINFIIFDNFTWRGVNYINAKYVPIIQNKIVAQTFDYTLSHSSNFYQNSLSGKISKQITNLADGVTKIITSTSANFLRGISLLFTAFITTYYVNPIFCYILVVWFLFFSIFSIWMSKKLVYLSDVLAKEESNVTGELVDSISNQANIRIFSRKDYEYSRMIPFLDNQKKAYTKNYLYSTLLYSIQGGLIAAMMGFSVFYLIRLYAQGNVTVGDFVLILGLSMETGHIMWFTMSEVDRLNEAVGRCKQSMESLFVPIEILDKPNAIDLNCTKGKITFDSVKFNYKGNEPLFQNISIEIKAGQKVGLVGYSGGGKSTFVNLILRFL